MAHCGVHSHESHYEQGRNKIKGKSLLGEKVARKFCDNEVGNFHVNIFVRLATATTLNRKFYKE